MVFFMHLINAHRSTNPMVKYCYRGVLALICYRVKMYECVRVSVRAFI